MTYSKLVYRKHHEIVVDMLFESLNVFKKGELIDKGVAKTKMMYLSNLSHNILEKYLKILEKYSLLKKKNNRYIVTNYALNFLEKYTERDKLVRRKSKKEDKISNMDNYMRRKFPFIQS